MNCSTNKLKSNCEISKTKFESKSERNSQYFKLTLSTKLTLRSIGYYQIVIILVYVFLYHSVSRFSNANKRFGASIKCTNWIKPTAKGKFVDRKDTQILQN